MLKINLSLLMIFIAVHAPVLSTKRHNTATTIRIEVDLPWYLIFEIPAMQNFEPVAIKAKIHHFQATSTIRRQDAENIEFMLQAGSTSTQRRFRNMNPLRLRINDLIEGLLEYKTTGTNGSVIWKNARFNYTIQNKQFDIVPLNVPRDPLIDTNEAQAKEENQEDEERALAPNENKDFYTTDNKKPTKSDVIDNYPSRQNIPPARLQQQQKQQQQERQQQEQQQQNYSLCVSAEAFQRIMTEMQFLEAQLRAALDVGKIGTHLLLTDDKHKPPPSPLFPPLNSNAVDTIRSIITNKLQLPQLSQSVLQARFVDDGLLFELSTPLQKLQVLAKANLLLKDSRYKIISTERNIYETAIFARFKN